MALFTPLLMTEKPLSLMGSRSAEDRTIIIINVNKSADLWAILRATRTARHGILSKACAFQVKLHKAGLYMPSFYHVCGDGDTLFVRAIHGEIGLYLSNGLLF